MSKVKLTITESKCRCGYVKKGDTFIVDAMCPDECRVHVHGETIE